MGRLMGDEKLWGKVNGQVEITKNGDLIEKNGCLMGIGLLVMGMLMAGMGGNG